MTNKCASLTLYKVNNRSVFSYANLTMIYVYIALCVLGEKTTLPTILGCYSDVSDWWGMSLLMSTSAARSGCR